jgi:hypothetical protein
MWNTKQWAGRALAALALAGCADGARTAAVTGPAANDVSATADPRGRVYDQQEFLGNPLVSEVTIVKANHQAYNRTQPYNTGPFLQESANFITGVAGRPASLATTLGSVLYPDILVVQSDRNPATAGWLSWALANGWGGRTLSDDVVDAGLMAIFGDLVSPDGASCRGRTLPLCTDNVDANDKAFSTAFPYLAAPTLSSPNT